MWEIKYAELLRMEVLTHLLYAFHDLAHVHLQVLEELSEDGVGPICIAE